MSKETDDLQKAIDISKHAVDALQKSHVKEHTRVSASGAVSQVSAYDDKRQKAQEASATADQNRRKLNFDKPNDMRRVAEDHAAAADAHIEALKHATSNEDINNHMHAASRHLQEADGLHSYANSQDRKGGEGKKASTNADRAEKHAYAIGRHAKSAEGDESTSEGLNKKVSMHMLAMEQHQRAHGHHMAAANRNFDDEEVRGYHMDHAGDNQNSAQEHGKEVQRLSQTSIDARDKAYGASDKAKTSGKPEDHKAAADAHSAAARLNYDSEGQAEHEKLAKEHDAKTKPVGSDHPHPWNAHHKDVTKDADSEEGYDDGENMHLAAHAMKHGNHAKLKQVLKHSDNYVREKVSAHIHPDHWQDLGVKALDKDRTTREFEKRHPGK